MTFDPKQIPIAVALIRSADGQLTIAWNDNWQSFVLPMTKIHSVGPVVETAEQAAVRAAAEVLHVPCRVVPGKTGQAMRTLQLGMRDGEIKDYHFTIVPIEVHPQFQKVSFAGRSVLQASSDALLSGELQPLSPSIEPILKACIDWAWV